MYVLDFKRSFGAMSGSELEARLKKCKKYKDNLDPFLRLSEDLFDQIIFFSLRVPFESSLKALSSVCKYWNKACVDLKPQLFYKYVSQAQLPRPHTYVDQQHMQLGNFDQPHDGPITAESMEGIESHINTSCQITALPKELLPVICSYAVDFSSKRTLKLQLENISLVGKDWHRACVPLYLNAINTLPLSRLFEWNDFSTVVHRLLKLETSDQKLLSLNFSSSELSAHEFPLLTQLKHLQKLNLADSEVDKNALLSLAQLPALRVLKFMCYDPVVKSEIGEVTKLTRLKALSLNFEDIRDCGLRTIAKLTQLRALELMGPDACEVRGFNHELQALTLFTDLKHLKLQCEGMTQAGYESLWQLTQLRSLHLGWRMWLENNTVRRLTELRRLSLATDFKCTEVTLQEIAQLTQLEALIFPKISCKELEKLSALTRLTSLNHAPIKRFGQEPA